MVGTDVLWSQMEVVDNFTAILYSLFFSPYKYDGDLLFCQWDFCCASYILNISCFFLFFKYLKITLIHCPFVYMLITCTHVQRLTCGNSLLHCVGPRDRTLVVRNYSKNLTH